MKTVTILFVEKNAKYIFENVFDGNSAFGNAVKWALGNKSEKIFCFSWDSNKEILEKQISLLKKDIEIISSPLWTTEKLISEAQKAAGDNDADSVIYAWADCPFLNRAITNEIYETHTEFMAEYTYAEGYPYGFAPEMIDSGTLGILKQLAETTQKQAGEVAVNREAFFDFLKTDINAFEIETVLADEDYRLLRYGFDCSKKENFLSCKALFESLNESEKGDLSLLNAEKLSESSSKNCNILKTVPGFYNIQLSPDSCSKPDYIPEDSPLNKGEKMDCEKAVKLIDKIAAFSENAVISLSYFGDPVTHPDFIKICQKILSFPGLSVFIETDYLPKETVLELQKIANEACDRTNGYSKVMIAFGLDASSANIFSKIRGRSESDFEKVCKNISEVSELFPDSTFPQFIRLNENEGELESFYRYWNEKTSPSKGNLIIQKYNSFCKSLPDRKPADLSPVERNVCWHLRRDMNILASGEVTFCHCIYSKIVGNAFENELSEIWKAFDEEIKNQSENKYCTKCGDCDEYYTFNF